ncbi:type 1 periplasmic-binding domain-containing protein [Facilibium subflavum]|uniref:hypothetical protein n=1 Tax=Facilibium subflavum TaxID=2219058 RepID=UPI000E659F59|nr:hypothetical protein [Facilibium subflavum]
MRQRIFISIIAFTFLCNIVFANALRTIKVAVLDNFHFQPFITTQYGEHYLQGIALAATDFRRYGYTLSYRVFSYDRSHPLAILKAVKEVNTWHPDLILGPRNSNMFFLISSQFKKVLVLSGFATADALSALPKNYYSLVFPDKILSCLMYHYISTHYPKQNVYAIVENNCKNCVNFANEFARYYNSAHSDPMVIKTYISTDMASINLHQLLSDYHGGLILLPNTAYSSALLMVKITNYLQQSVVFLGGDDWGMWQDTEVGKLKADKPYYGLHFTPLTLAAEKDEKLARFKKAYWNFYREIPDNPAAFLSYNALESVLAALRQFPNNHPSSSMAANILASYQRARHAYPNWYRLDTYSVFKLDTNKEALLAFIPALDQCDASR